MTCCIEIQEPGKLGENRRRRRTATVAALTIITASASTTMAGLLVEPLHHEFAWSHGTIGFAVSVNMALYGLTAPFAAAWMDRFGIHRVVAAALMAIAAGAVLALVMTDAWEFTLCWGVLVGLGCGSMAMTFAATVANRWFVQRRGLITGVLTAASVFGQFAFLPLLAWIVDHLGWRAAVAAVALAALMVAPLAWLGLRDHPAEPVRGAGIRSIRVLLGSARTAPFWLLAATFAICGASTNGLMWTHFAPAEHDHGMPITVAAALLTTIGICNVVGTIGSGWLTDRYSVRWLLAGYYVLRGISLLFLPFLLAATVRPAMIVFLILFGLLDVATVPPTIALCRQFYAKDSAVVFGWVNASHQVGAGLVAFLGGVARDAIGSYDVVWVGGGALCAVAAVLALTVTRS